MLMGSEFGVLNWMVELVCDESNAFYAAFVPILNKGCRDTLNDIFLHECVYILYVFNVLLEDFMIEFIIPFFL